MATQTQLVTGVDFVTVPTRDYEAAAKFYGEVLGLPFGKRWGNMPADGNALDIHHRYAPPGAKPGDES